MSIRRYLVLILVSVITLVVFIAAIQGYKTSMQQAANLFDLQLKSFADTLENLNLHKTSISVNNNDTFAFQLWKDTKLISKSSNAPSIAISQFKQGFSDNNFSGQRWRVYSQHRGEQWIMVAQLFNPRFELAEKVILSAVIPIVLTIPLLSLIIFFIVSNGLKPLQRLKEQLHKKNINDLSSVTIAQSGKELQPVIDTLNSVLSQLDNAYDREKRFASDAAHELRTPLSALKINVHNLQYELGTENELLNYLTNSADRMAHVIEQILKLNQTNPEQFSQQMQAMALTPIVQKAIAQLYSEISTKGQSIELKDEAMDVYGNEFCFITLLQNLIGNASKYTPENGKILVTTKKVENDYIIQIEDSGPGIANDELNKVFDRFYRVGGDRHSSKVIGCGLGLSIVKHIVVLHQASINLSRSEKLQGLKVTVRFPLSLNKKGRS